MFVFIDWVSQSDRGVQINPVSVLCGRRIGLTLAVFMMAAGRYRGIEGRPSFGLSRPSAGLVRQPGPDGRMASVSLMLSSFK